MICTATKADGSPCRSPAKKGGELCSLHLVHRKRQVDLSAEAVTVNLGRPQRPGLGSGLRTVKMLRPRCEICQSPENVSPRWWEKCVHRPYVSKVEKPETKPVLERQEDGSTLVTGHQTRITYHEEPNLVQVALSIRHNDGRGPEEKRRLFGYLLPEEHDPPFASFCEYLDCWNQNTKPYRNGNYCREDQARMIAADVQGVRLETHNMEKRRKQWEEITA